MEIYFEHFNEATGQKTFYRAAYPYLSPPFRLLFSFRNICKPLLQIHAKCATMYTVKFIFTEKENFELWEEYVFRIMNTSKDVKKRLS